MKKKIIALLILILIIIIYEWRVYLFVKNTISYNFHNINFKTGDIIIFRRDKLYDLRPVYYIMGLVSFIISGSIYSHVGMVVVINNVSYIYHIEFFPEYDHYRKKFSNSLAVLNNLEETLYTYHGDVLYYPIKKEISMDVMGKQMKEHENDKVSLNLFSYFNSLFKIPFNEQYRVICTELISSILQNLGIIAKNLEPYKYNLEDMERAVVDSGNFLRGRIIRNNYHHIYKSVVF